MSDPEMIAEAYEQEDRINRTRFKLTPEPLPDVPAGVPGHRVLHLKMETTSPGLDGDWARIRYSGKEPVYLPRKVVGLPSGMPWAATYIVPVWFFRQIRDRL